MAKSKKVEKETRRLIETVTDCVKRKGDGYKFKSKNKKMVKKIKTSCVHWVYRKGKETPTVIQDPNVPGYWKCTICGQSFPIKPDEDEDVSSVANAMLMYVNQMQFFGVKLGGDASDTKMFLELKRDIPRFVKVAEHIHKRVNKRAEFEKNRANGNTMSQFAIYNGFNYN
jgi:hypothetical protein